MVVLWVSGVVLDGESRPGARRAFFEGGGSIAMDSDWCLRYLSRNLAFKLEVISSSSPFSFSSQIIRGTNRFTPASTLSLENEEDKEDEED